MNSLIKKEKKKKRHLMNSKAFNMLKWANKLT